MELLGKKELGNKIEHFDEQIKIKPTSFEKMCIRIFIRGKK